MYRKLTNVFKNNQGYGMNRKKKKQSRKDSLRIKKLFRKFSKFRTFEKVRKRH